MQTDTTHNAGEVMALESAHVLQTYRRAPVVFERGSGCRLYDAAGRAYLDFISGIGVSSLGHAHPRLIAAIAAQAGAAAAHVEPVLPSAAGGSRGEARRAVRAAARVLLQQRHGGRRGVLKFARRYWFSQGTPRTAGRRASSAGSMAGRWERCR